MAITHQPAPDRPQDERERGAENLAKANGESARRRERDFCDHRRIDLTALARRPFRGAW